MPKPPLSRPVILARRVRIAAVLAGLSAVALGVVAGWISARSGAHGPFPGRDVLAPAGACGLVLLGLGIGLVAWEWRRAWVRRLAFVPAVATVALGLALLWEEATGVDLLFTEPLTPLQVLARGGVPGLTSGGLVLAAMALALIALGGRWRLIVAQVLALVALAMAGIGLTGQAYALDALRLGESPFARVSVPGLVGLVAVILGLLLARTEVGALRLLTDSTAGGVSFRRLLPVTALLVIGLGALRVWGEARGLFPGAVGSALFAVTTVFLMAGLIVWDALRLRTAELAILEEQEIRDERQRQFRHAIVEAPIPIVMFADDGEVLQVSRMAEEVTGHPRDELTDLATWGRILGEEHGAEATSQLLLASLDEFHEIEVRTRDDRRRIWRIRTSALGPLADLREAYVTMTIDLTEIRRADEQKDEFLAVLGHELRNPLAALSTGLELQRRHEDPERRAAVSDMMRRQVRHLGRLLDDLLDVSRISRGKIALRPEVLSLCEAVEQVVEEHRGGAGSREPDAGPRISLTVPPRPIPVSADPTRLHQILGNLLGNAVKYTPAEGRVWVTVEREDDEAVVRVRDSGVGMDEHEIETAFEPFRQLGHAEARQRGGLGLGLTLVRQLATLHGGSVTGASRGRGTGSTFVLRLPVASGDIPASALPSAARDGEAARGLRVLVVDDQRDVADGFAELLSLSGHEVAAAYDGAGALDLAESHRPHVVFLDLDLPDFDGRTVARRIRERVAETPVLIAVSGFGGDRHFERSREAGIDRHLVKPIDLAQVLELLREVARAAPAR